MKHIKCPKCGQKDSIIILFRANAYSSVIIDDDGAPIPGYGVEYEIERVDHLECWDCGWTTPLSNTFNQPRELRRQLEAHITVVEED